MWCEICRYALICKYRAEVESVLKQNESPYYIRNNKNEVTPVKQIFSCDCFALKEDP